MKQPVELIVANATHAVVSRLGIKHPLVEAAHSLIVDNDPKNGEVAYRGVISKGFAEHLLCQIAHHASDAVVRKALAAIGAPHEDAEIWDRLESAKDAQKREAGESPVAN